MNILVSILTYFDFKKYSKATFLTLWGEVHPSIEPPNMFSTLLDGNVQNNLGFPLIAYLASFLNVEIIFALKFSNLGGLPRGEGNI